MKLLSLQQNEEVIDFKKLIFFLAYNRIKKFSNFHVMLTQPTHVVEF